MLNIYYHLFFQQFHMVSVKLSKLSNNLINKNFHKTIDFKRCADSCYCWWCMFTSSDFTSDFFLGSKVKGAAHSEWACFSGKDVLMITLNFLPIPRSRYIVLEYYRHCRPNVILTIWCKIQSCNWVMFLKKWEPVKGISFTFHLYSVQSTLVPAAYWSPSLHLSCCKVKVVNCPLNLRLEISFLAFWPVV